MAKDLTKAFLDNLKPGAARREVPDGHTRGLYFVLQPSGATSWALRYRVAGKNRKLTVGKFPEIDIKTARDLARKALAKIAIGGDPAAEKKTARTAAREPAKDLVEVVAERFIARHIRATLKAGPGGSAHETERLFRKEVVEPWRGRRMSEITTPDVYELLDAIIERGSGYTANRTLSALRTFFSWATPRSKIAQTNPCDGVRAEGVETKRDRWLDDAELKAVWAEAEALGGPFGSVLELLILLGQRLGETSGMRWAELDLEDKVWVLPRERTKNGKAHTVPLSPQAVAVIRATPRIAGPFVFTTGGTVPIDGWSRIKRIIDARLPDMEAWKIHDLRRSAATGLARIGVDIAVVERILNHTSGTFRGVVGTYQRHGFDDERRIALDRWGRHVEKLVAKVAEGEAESSNVVDIRGGATMNIQFLRLLKKRIEAGEKIDGGFVDDEARRRGLAFLAAMIEAIEADPQAAARQAAKIGDAFTSHLRAALDNNRPRDGMNLTPDVREMADHLFFAAMQNAAQATASELAPKARSAAGGRTGAPGKKATADARWRTKARCVAPAYVAEHPSATRADVIRAIRRGCKANELPTDKEIGKLVNAMRREGKIKLNP